MFDLAGSSVGGGFFWQGLSEAPDVVNLTDAHFGSLRDDWASWQGVKTVALSGLRYDRVVSDVRLSERLIWLSRKHDKHQRPKMPWVTNGQNGFDGQPYTHLAGVLRRQGDGVAAARLLQTRDKLSRRASFHRRHGAVDGSWGNAWASALADIRRPFDGLFRAMFGYGHRPAYAVGWVLGIWFSCFLLYGQVYAAGQMAPASDVVLVSEEWGRALSLGCETVKRPGCEMPLNIWDGGGDAARAMPSARDYETFSPALYALDLFVPLDALGQENAWAPSKDRGWWGWVGYWMRWVVQMADWVITAVGAATLTGLIGRRD